jgi:hypothetical protein
VIETTSPTTRCVSRLCALAGQPHTHCPCGLPMRVRDAMCRLCLLEGLEPAGRSATERDSTSYPARRRHRFGSAPLEVYGEFLRALLEGDEAEVPPRRNAVGRRHPRPVAPSLPAERCAVALGLARDLGGAAGQRAVTRGVEGDRGDSGSHRYPDVLISADDHLEREAEPNG